jgi:hypothetical protein
MIALSGCDAPVAANRGQQSFSESVRSASSKVSKTSWEAGMILAGRPGYQCLTLEAVGLKANDEVLSVTSSCDCLAPSLVKYATSQTAHASGILLQYVDESSPHGNGLARGSASSSEPTSPPAHLGVIFKLTLADGSTHEFTVNLLHTHLVEAVSLNEAAPADEEHPR